VAGAISLDPKRSKLVKDLKKRIEEAVLELEFSGVISIFRDDEVVVNQAFGNRDIKNQLPNNTDTLFGIASGTKIFTALGIGVLIDQGQINLDTTVGEIDSSFGGFIDEEATILQLLAHTSGIYDYYDEEIETDFDHFSVEIPWSELETPSDYFPLFKGQKMKFHPGERFSYSNGGYVFLGILIEKLTGGLYRDFITDHVLNAANMDRSGFYAFNDLPENTANGYLENRQMTNIYQLPLRGAGDGGMYTTTDDLRAFWKSLFANKILTESLTKIFLTTHSSISDELGYGCGLYKKLDDSIVSIMGGDAGVGFYSRYGLEDAITVNILSNITNGEYSIREVILDSL
jgi:CubicO group peptidase (beta-lactamase class C family)